METSFGTPFPPPLKRNMIGLHTCNYFEPMKRVATNPRTMTQASLLQEERSIPSAHFPTRNASVQGALFYSPFLLSLKQSIRDFWLDWNMGIELTEK